MDLATQLIEPLNVVKELPVMLTDTEKQMLGEDLARKEGERDVVQAQKRASNAKFNAQTKTLAKNITELVTTINRGTKLCDVPCIEGLHPETRKRVRIRLDTNDVLEGDSEKQPALPFGRPPVLPELRCTAVDDDGVAYSISAEQADALDREKGDGTVRAMIDGAHRTVTAILRGKACDVCGIVAPHHRPECAEMRREDAEARAEFDRDADDYDGEPDNGAAAIEALGGEVSDAPLVPPGDDSKPPRKSVQVKPKRKAKAATGAEAEAGE